MWLRRILNPNVPLSRRAQQAVNIVLETALSRRWQLAHVVEYPKCGGSWIRNMIRTYRGTELFTHNRLIRPHDVIMVHRLYRRRFYRPVIVVRDPRDAYVSFYHYETSFAGKNAESAVFDHYRHDPDRPVDEDFTAYLEAKLMHLSHPWFSYRQFLDAWLGRRHACLIRYEDCLIDPEKQLTRILRYLGEPINYERIAQTIEKTSFTAITKEKYGASRDAGHADNSHFHRKGVAGDWKNYFDEASCRLLERTDGNVLRRLGYETDDAWIDRFLDKRKAVKMSAATGSS